MTTTRGEFTADKLPGFMRERGEVHAFGVPTLDGYSNALVLPTPAVSSPPPSRRRPGATVAAFRASLRYCSEHEIDILVLPELAGTEDFPAILTQSTDSHPRVVIAGSRHMTDDGLRVNRQTVWYRHTNHLVCHDKSGRFFVGAPVVESDGVSEPNSAAMEDIDYGQTIRLHAGTDWSMAPLVCADFLDENVVRAVADIHPQTSPLTDADCATVAIFALPLSDPGQATIRVRPTASTSAPHLVHFRSARRTAELLSGIPI